MRSCRRKHEAGSKDRETGGRTLAEQGGDRGEMRRVAAPDRLAVRAAAKRVLRLHRDFWEIDFGGRRKLTARRSRELG